MSRKATKKEQATQAAIMRDLVAGFSPDEAATRNGTSVRTVMRVKAAYRKLPEAAELIATPQATATASNLLDQCLLGIEAGVRYLTAVAGNLDTTKANPAQVRMVADCIVETLANVVTAWRSLDIREAETKGKKPQPQVIDTTLATLSDTELREAVRGLGGVDDGEQAPPTGETIQ